MMKASKTFKFMCTAAVTAACAVVVAGCGGTDSSNPEAAMGDTTDYSGGVAATVNGVQIGENAVTAYIANFRNANSLTDDAQWGQWLVDGDYTAEKARDEVINYYYVEREVLKQAAADQGVTLDEAQVDAQINSMKANFDSEDAWKQALASSGTDETTYRAVLEDKMLREGLYNKVAVASDPSEEDLLMYAQMYAQTFDGAKKSSHILFAADDEATAQEVLDKINSGEMTFEDAVAQYSLDDGSKADAGNVGWDCMATFVSEYTDALDGLEKGQVSGLVTSDYGIHIIKCTDVFTAPEEVTSIDQLPTEFADAIKSTLRSSSMKASFNEWMNNYREGCDIQVNAMPEGLPYDIDLSGYTKSESAQPSAPAASAEPAGGSSSESETPAAGSSESQPAEQPAAPAESNAA